ncbi:MAG: ATP-binding protein [Bacteroidales bacterium]|jgi:signal transduction histidine kinase|nr:ATP-binding protein [Bacteroidales bacterium]
MKIEINFTSFRFKIVTTIIVVITVMSFFSFYIYNYYLSKKIYENAKEDILSVLTLMKGQIVAVHDGRIIKPSLRQLDKNGQVIHSYLIDADGKVLYPSQFNPNEFDTINLRKLASLPNDITLTTFQDANVPFSRAIIRLKNSPTCYNCHASTKPILGYIGIDFAMHSPGDTIAFTRQFSFIFTVILILLVLGFVLTLHYKIVRKSLSEFQKAINVINQGNLNERLTIPKSTELGRLGKSFNEMVGHFQQTQNELQKYHQQEIRTSQKLATIGEMSARLAHEIRNPITGIANAIEIIIEETKDTENKPVLEEIQRQANRVNKAVSNLLNYSRSKDLNPQEADINEIIKSVVFFLENQAINKKINFKVELGKDIPLFYFDPEQVENVLLNLGLNAVQASDVRGTITYETSWSAAGKKVQIAVRDTGIGIPEDKLPDIFKPFYTTRTQGTGLGLAIVKEIIDMHQGEIRVENNPDKGCTFYISLPVN